MIVEKIVYCLQANLSKGNPLDTFTWDFQVFAESTSKAIKMLEEYLSVPENTGIKYKEFVGIKLLSSETILVEDKVYDNK